MLAATRKRDSCRCSALVQRRQLRKQAGRSRIVGGPRSCIFLAKPELQHAADAVAFRVSTVGLEISHFTILFKGEMTKTMIDICKIEAFRGDWKAFV